MQVVDLVGTIVKVPTDTYELVYGSKSFTNDVPVVPYGPYLSTKFSTSVDRASSCTAVH
eukprot:SAG31_NODE_2307_length_5969_cov_21.904940_2_plen_59_part_00